MFDLNKKIASWRSQLFATDIYRDSDLDELETHLRDEITELKKHKVLSEEEAYWIANFRIGDTLQLNNEFSKVNTTYIWKKRLFWLLGGYVLLNVAHVFAQSASQLLFLFGAKLGIETPLLLQLDVMLKIFVIGSLFYLALSKRVQSFLNNKLRYIQKFKKQSTIKKLLLLVPVLIFAILGKFFLLPIITKMFELNEIGKMMISNTIFDNIWQIVFFISFIFITLSIYKTKMQTQHA